MSLLRLLSAGKSLVGLKQEAARYRMSDPRAMPRFGSARNPFKARKGNQTEAKPSAALAVSPTRESSPRDAKVTPGVVQQPKNPAPTRLAARVESRLKRWLAQCGDKLKFRRREKKPKRVVQPRPVRGPVQGELSLEAIRVVRNDLSDTDFEVVTRKSGPSAAPARASSQPLEQPQPIDAEAARRRMAARLFCAGKT